MTRRGLFGIGLLALLGVKATAAKPVSSSCVITRIGFRQGILTGTAPVFRVSLQTLSDHSGFPDGTEQVFDYTPTAGNNSTWQWIDLPKHWKAKAGDRIVVRHQTGTIDAGMVR